MKTRIQVVLDENVEKRFKKELARVGLKKGGISEEIETLIRKSLDKIESKIPLFKQKDIEKIDIDSLKEIETFYQKIKTLEKELGRGLIILRDKKSGAYYTECHIESKELSEHADVDAVIDPENQEEFRLNRKLEKKHPAFQDMLSDALNSRQFSDIVIDFNRNYRANIPLKILGGQHRIVAIKESVQKQINVIQGIKVYFNLNVDKRVEIAGIANTNINVSLDLRDRLKEQQLKPAGRLREWAWGIGLLEKGEDFAEKRRVEQKEPTVRMLRTFIINFYRGKKFKGDITKEAVEPYKPLSGGMDLNYLKIFDEIKSKPFFEQRELTKAAKEFVELHNKQIEKAPKEYRYKSLNLAIISAWAFAAGNLQKDKGLKKLYDIPSDSGKNDPLNGSIMAKARHTKIDPEAYRGLGTRDNEKERGRLLQLFYRYAKSNKKGITLPMCNAAIKFYHYNKDKEKIKKEETAF